MSGRSCRSGGPHTEAANVRSLEEDRELSGRLRQQVPEVTRIYLHQGFDSLKSGVGRWDTPGWVAPHVKH